MSLKFKLAWGISVIILSLVCGMSFMLLMFNLLGRAYVLSTISPPHYPASQLEQHKTGGGSGGTWVTYIYHTKDDHHKVLAFMEPRMQGFTTMNDKEKEPLRNTPIHSNSACTYDTLLGRYFYSRGKYPCISLSIYPDPDEPSETVLEVSEWYPER